MRNQNGFATLEIIIVMLIISALAGVIVPKITRIVDIANLDYEVKKFRSEFLFARSLSRSEKFNATIFSSVDSGEAITLHVRNKSYEINRGTNSVRGNNLLPNGFSITYQKGLDTLIFAQGKILDGKSGTYIFTSPLKNQRNLVLDSVGRLRIDEND